MSPLVKWIGGGSLAAVAALVMALSTGWSLQSEQADPEQWLAPDDALAEPAPVPAARPVVAPAPLASPAAEQPFVIKRILPIDGPIRYGEWHWNEDGAPAEGPLVVTVDLQARVLSVFRGGYEIGAAAVLLGTPEHPTPVGLFPILSKERHNVSEKYGNAPMPWTLRLTHDGVAIHGGAEVELGYASHGCIGSPDAFVSKLFAIAKAGDKVIITDGKRADVGDALI